MRGTTLNDLDAATLILGSLAEIDGGCSYCIDGAVAHAVFEAPDLPWDEALGRIRRDSTRNALAEAVKRARMITEDVYA